jgi:MipA family protein
MTTRFLSVLLLLALPPAPAAALEGNLEIGAGLMALYLPEYRGTDEYFSLVLPFPYVYYEGKRVQVGREGLRARLFSLDNVSLSLSVSASPPAGDDSNPPRQDMPELLPIFELGPSVDWALIDTESEKLRLRFPVRYVIATDFTEYERAGWIFEPHAQWQRRGTLGDWRTTTSVSGGPIWASAEYHEHFYGVAPEFVTAERPFYAGAGGYSGTRVTLSWGFRRDQWRFVTFAQYDWLKGTAFDDSPLFESEHALMTGVMMTFRLYRSSETPEDGVAEE